MNIPCCKYRQRITHHKERAYASHPISVLEPSRDVPETGSTFNRYVIPPARPGTSSLNLHPPPSAFPCSSRTTHLHLGDSSTLVCSHQMPPTSFFRPFFGLILLVAARGFGNMLKRQFLSIFQRFIAVYVALSMPRPSGRFDFARGPPRDRCRRLLVEDSTTTPTETCRRPKLVKYAQKLRMTHDISICILTAYISALYLLSLLSSMPFSRVFLIIRAVAAYAYTAIRYMPQ